jgi:hypothetical protein
MAPAPPSRASRPRVPAGERVSYCPNCGCNLSPETPDTLPDEPAVEEVPAPTEAADSVADSEVAVAAIAAVAEVAEHGMDALVEEHRQEEETEQVEAIAEAMETVAVAEALEEAVDETAEPEAEAEPEEAAEEAAAADEPIAVAVPPQPEDGKAARAGGRRVQMNHRFGRG